jgi:hydrogenase 3 maturation protease
MKNELLDILRSCSEPKICVLGIGSEFKADDSAGVVIVNELQRMCDEKKCIDETRVMFLNCSTAPENFTGFIKEFGPTHLMLIDAAEMGEKPGTIKFIPSGKVGGVSFATHVLPIAVMINYLKQSIKFESVIMGIEPKNLVFGTEMSSEVKEATKKLSALIFEVLDTCLNK